MAIRGTSHVYESSGNSLLDSALIVRQFLNVHFHAACLASISQVASNAKR